jgi:predicted RNA binding protein YcfA (HicA-like mRNA interferase family)
MRAVTAREVVAALKADGWVLARTKGSHAQFRHDSKPGLVTVPMHTGELPIGTLKSIEKQAAIRLRR